MARRILLVEDEPKIRELLRAYLAADGFEIIEAPTGADALNAVKRGVDLVLLDIGLPDIDGLAVLAKMRADADPRVSDVYVILVTARAEEVDKLVGLSVGADDYITKPFSPREVVARVRTVLRRMRGSDDAGSAGDAGAAGRGAAELLRFDGLTINLPRREVRVAKESPRLAASVSGAASTGNGGDDASHAQWQNGPEQATPLTADAVQASRESAAQAAGGQDSAGELVELSALDFDILVCLARAPGRVFSRAQLLEAAWGYDVYVEERVVDVHIRTLRAALGDPAADPRIVGTVRGVGYKFLLEPIGDAQ